MKQVSAFFLLISVFIFSCKDKSEKSDFNKQQIVTINSDHGTYYLSALTEEIVKLSFNDSIITSDEIYAPVMTEEIEMEVIENDSTIIAKTSELRIQITKSPFKLTYFDNNGNIKLELNGGVNRIGDSVAVNFSLKPDESIYGTGFRAIPLNRRGYSYLAYNKPQYAYGEGATELNYSIPHWMSSSNYMMMIDNPSKSYFDIGKTNKDELIYSSYRGNLSFYFIEGANFRELIRNYTRLTGNQPLPPIWALGNFQSRFGYESQQEAENILDRSLNAGYPTDALILDIFWFGPEIEDGRMGDLKWNKEKWPEPVKMIDNFKEKGVKTILITEPFFTKKSQYYKYLASNGLLGLDKDSSVYELPDFYFGDAGLLDIFNPKAQKWIWQEYKRMKEYGAAGWWVDLGEPETHPDSMYHYNGRGYEVHGAYGHEWAKVMYNGYAADFPNERLFLLARAGFAGTQRFGLIPWSGDVGRNWSGFKPQPSIIMSMGLSGIGYMHSDAGGFTFVEEKDPELYTRWVQFAAFSPIFRPHADQSAPAEPVMWSEDVQKNVKPFVELRYELLPYNYTMAWENTTTGMPLMRPMFIEYPSIPDTLQTQYMWGDDFLIAPILNPGVKNRKVYLPEGEWYNYWTDEKLNGGKWIDVSVTMENIPVFVKGGSIIPTTEVIRSTDYYDTDSVQLNYYYKEGINEDKIYFDDGLTNKSWLENKYDLITVNVNSNSSSITFAADHEGNGFKGAPSTRVYKIVIHGIKSEPLGMDQEKFSWVSKKSLLSFYSTLRNDETVNLN
ncbi:DUF4968 domain-containing protein [Mangrovivirga sp. M17]|uniref:DUF4968 domain-containing protein n=1 Tax=Mangrovivirga halotolerans TaxID=2993936 RepID=A0ABT3RMW4_9BACT|nr:TIM-barrel domain-containing protein [Mangrovivirga halotolerans]MCX2742612.1 DUF4968 domain-containing protein [Mangrovivirga halotolerans]